MVNLNFESCVVSINRFAIFLFKTPEFLMRVTIVSEGFDNLVKFHFIARFSPGKCFVNLARFPSSVSEHNSNIN